MAFPESYRHCDSVIRPLAVSSASERAPVRLQREPVTLGGDEELSRPLVESLPDGLAATAVSPGGGSSVSAALAVCAPFPSDVGLLWRIRFANAELPPSPLLEGLLKPG